MAVLSPKGLAADVYCSESARRLGAQLPGNPGHALLCKLIPLKETNPQHAGSAKAKGRGVTPRLCPEKPGCC